MTAAPDPVGVTIRPATEADLDFAWRLYRDLMRDLTEALVGWNEERQRENVRRDLLDIDGRILAPNGQ